MPSELGVDVVVHLQSLRPKMQRLVQIDFVGEALFQAVLPNTVFVVSMSEVLGKLVGNAVDEHP